MEKRTMPPEWYASQAARRKGKTTSSLATKSSSKHISPSSFSKANTSHVPYHGNSPKSERLSSSKKVGDKNWRTSEAFLKKGKSGVDVTIRSMRNDGAGKVFGQTTKKHTNVNPATVRRWRKLIKAKASSALSEVRVGSKRTVKRYK